MRKWCSEYHNFISKLTIQIKVIKNKTDILDLKQNKNIPEKIAPEGDVFLEKKIHGMYDSMNQISFT